MYRAQLWEILSALAFRSGLLAGVTPSHRSIPMGTWDGKRSLGGEGEERQREAQEAPGTWDGLPSKDRPPGGWGCGMFLCPLASLTG